MRPFANIYLSKFTAVALAALWVFAAPVSQSAASRPQKAQRVFTYQNPENNPVVGGLRDPFILKVDGVYYMTGTTMPFFELDYAQFGPNPGVKLWQSDDLKDWKYDGLIVAHKEGSWYQDRFWAPEIHVEQTKTGRKFYCTFDCFNQDLKTPQSIGLAVADKITGPYAVLTPDHPLWKGNDADLFTDTDGKDYLFRAGVSATQVDLADAKTIGAPFTVIPDGAPTDWDTGPGIGREGPEVIKIKDTYYCFYSSWGRGYEVGYSTAKNIRGPWTKYADNPIYGAQSRAYCARFHKAYTQAPDVPYNQVGHGSPFIGPDGRWWISAHFGGEGQPPGAPKMHGYCLPGYDPLNFEDGVFEKTQPTWTPQTVVLPDH